MICDAIVLLILSYMFGNKKLNWQNQKFCFFLGVGHHKGIMLRAPKMASSSTEWSVLQDMARILFYHIQKMIKYHQQSVKRQYWCGTTVNLLNSSFSLLPN